MARPARNTVARDTALAEKRKKRAKLGGNRDVLTVAGKDDGYVYRWFTVNDNGGRYSEERLMLYKELGWEHVSGSAKIGDESIDAASNMGDVKSKRVGGGDTLYLMRIEKELYDEAQEAKQAEVAEREQAMKNQLNSGKDGQYGKVEIK
jgi:hypothetical protein